MFIIHNNNYISGVNDYPDKLSFNLLSLLFLNRLLLAKVARFSFAGKFVAPLFLTPPTHTLQYTTHNYLTNSQNTYTR